MEEEPWAGHDDDEEGGERGDDSYYIYGGRGLPGVLAATAGKGGGLGAGDEREMAGQAWSLAEYTPEEQDIDSAVAAGGTVLLPLASVMTYRPRRPDFRRLLGGAQARPPRPIVQFGDPDLRPKRPQATREEKALQALLDAWTAAEPDDKTAKEWRAWEGGSGSAGGSGRLEEAYADCARFALGLPAPGDDQQMAESLEIVLTAPGPAARTRHGLVQLCVARRRAAAAAKPV